MWRKQRVLLADAASHRAELQRRLEWDHRGLVRWATPHARAHPVLEGEVRSAVALSHGECGTELEQLGADEAGIRAAIEILEDDGPHAHEEALAALTWEVREGWEEAVLEERLSDGPSLLNYLRESPSTGSGCSDGRST